MHCKFGWLSALFTLLASCSAYSELPEMAETQAQALSPNLTVRIDFETATQLTPWKLYQGVYSSQVGGFPPCTACSASLVTTAAPAPVFDGNTSMKLRLVGEAGDNNQLHIQNSSPGVAPTAGGYVLYHLWIPKGHAIQDLHGYTKHGTGNNYIYADTYVHGVDIPGDSWLSIYAPYPSCSTALREIGFDITLSRHWEDDIYIDSLAW